MSVFIFVNKIKKEKGITGEERKKKKDEEGEENIFGDISGEKTPKNLATKLYYMLLRAKNARIILLSGTPICTKLKHRYFITNNKDNKIKSMEKP